MRCAAIVTGPDTYLDHLGVLSALLEMPLLITEPKTYEIARTFYPQAQARLISPVDLTLEFLAAHFDVLFESGKFCAAELAPLLSLMQRKQMRFVFCPHGNSDKGHSLNLHPAQDIALYYGDHMLNLLTNTGALSHIRATIRTGNYRLPFYRAHQAFYDTLADQQIRSFFCTNKPTLLYAPTWNDGENPSSFFAYCEEVIEQLSQPFNLIIKLHPFLEEFHPAHTYRVLSTYEKSRNILFLTHFPAIYSLLACTDIYLGDYSSIGYDFLAFDRPLYFLTPEPSFQLKTSPHSICQCGIRITDKNHLRSFICSTLEENQQVFAAARKAVYHYVFGEERESKEVFQELQKCINEKTPLE